MASKKTVNVAVIGLGVGRGHVKAYQAYERANVAAVCDTRADRLERAAAEFGIAPERCFADHRRLLAAAGELQLDAADVALPNALHAPVTIDAFRAGLHVLCEKPMALNARQARAMLAAAEKAHRKLMVNFSYRFHPQSRALKDVVDSGAIGEVYFGRTIWHRRRGIPGFGGWFGQKALAGGGPIIDLGVHRLDLAMWLMGSPRPVTVSGSTYNVIASRLARSQRKRFDVEDLGCAFIRFDNGATLILEASWAGFSEKREDMLTQLLGTKGGICQRNVGEGYEFEARVFSEGSDAIWNAQLQQTTAPVPDAHREFVDAIIEDREPLAPGRHGLDVQLILDAVYRSAATGREVAIRPR